VFFASSYGISPVWTFFRMTRALTTMDASLRELIPTANFHKLVKDYYRRRAARTRGRLAARLRDGGQNVRDWFELQDRMLDDLRFRGGIVRRAAQVFEHTTSQISLFFARLFGVVATLHVAAGVGLLAAWLLQGGHDWVARILPAAVVAALGRVPAFDWQVWVLIFVGLLFSYRIFAVLSKRFRERDIGPGEE
jgi:hypothetical protein